MNKKSVKYSILIPTFNKAEYLQYTIKSILDIDYKNFELIISDDFSTDETPKILNKIKDERVKVIRPPCKLTQTKNYEFLLNHANGDWITILGDDDGILPYFFTKLDYYIEKFKDVEAISTKPAIYYWNNVEDLYGNRVCDYQNFFEKEKLENSKLSLFFALSGLKNRTNLPMIYTSGLVKKSLIEKIKKKSNNFFFHSVIPDYYSMIAIMYETEKYLKINEPLFWVGVSKFSTGIGTRIYIESKNENYSFINKNLEISKNISSKLHKIGISSIYFFECVLKHPYMSYKWQQKLIKYVVYSSSEIIFNEIFSKNKSRIKIDITEQEFKEEINFELIKNKLSKKLFYLIKFLIFLINRFKIFYNFFIRFNNFIKKKIFKYPIIVVSNDRNKFQNFIECNFIINKKLNKKL